MKYEQRLTTKVTAITMLALGFALSSCNKDLVNDPTASASAQQVEEVESPIPTTPPSMVIPADNQLTSEQIEFGRALFFDNNMGVPFSGGTKKTNSMACASCHASTAAFSDNVALSTGLNGRTGTRNAPSLINVAYNTNFTWDGRFTTLEDHIPGPMFSQVEMGNNFSRVPEKDPTDGYDHTPGGNDTLLLFSRLKNGPSRSLYITKLANIYHDTVLSLNRIVKAIACFERTIVSTGSPFDQYNQSLHKQGGNPNAISESAKRGFKLFIDPASANCVSCHSGYNFTDGGFHNNGLDESYSGNKTGDIGRAKVTGVDADQFKFKVPTLRNVALTGPYMHDGRFSTLQEVVDQYNKGGHLFKYVQTLDKNIKPLNLSAQDTKDIIAFLQSLTDTQYDRSMATNNDSRILK